MGSGSFLLLRLTSALVSVLDSLAHACIFHLTVENTSIGVSVASSATRKDNQSRYLYTQIHSRGR